MSEKVKLTRNQVEALRNAVGRYGEDLTVIRHAERYFHKEDEQVLTELTTAEVAKALYIGYEVEETFEVGDWVKDTSTNAVIKINDRQHRNNLIDPRHTTIRHATPEEIAKEKQRRWWAKHGRDVWELRDGDLLRSNDTKKTYELNNQTSYGAWFEGLTSGIAHRVVKRNYKIVCFAEDRKDIDGGDNE